MSLSDRDKKVIWHPFTPQKRNREIIPISRGEGVYLYDESGRKYIDAISSWWVNLHGHANLYIADKVYRQAQKLEQVIFAGFTHEPAIELAERLIKILPGKFSKIFYSDDGSTSTEVAIKMALQYFQNTGETKRVKILALLHSYHGDTFGAMSVSNRGIFTMPFRDKLFDVEFIDTTIDVAAQLSRVDLNKFACLIYEPLLQGAGGMKMYSPEILDQIMALSKSSGLICIADEVMTGFGRTGKLFASAYCIQQPDIICLSKGLTGGTMALGVTACTEKIFDAFVDDSKLKMFFHGHSFTGNPLACTAALASLDLLEKDACRQSIDNIISQNTLFLQHCRTHFSKKAKNFRQIGTVLAFELIAGEKDEYINQVSDVITEKALRLGVYIRPLGNTVYIMPPYCITTEELNKIYSTLELIIDN